MDRKCGLIRTNLSCDIQANNLTAARLYLDGNQGTPVFVTIELYVIGMFCIIGLVGNVLSAIVLHQEKERREAVYLLQALAVADALYLVVSLLRYPMKYIVLDRSTHTVMQPYVFPLLKTCQTICIWMMVFVTSDRYIFVCHPLSAKLCNCFTKRIIVSVIPIVAVLYNLPRFFAQCILWIQDVCTDKIVSHMIYTPVFRNKLYFDIYGYAMYIIFLYMAPLAILCFMNLRLVTAIRYSRRRNVSGHIVSNSQYKENNATLVLIILVISFIVCETPELILKILILIHREFQNISLFSLNRHLENFNAFSALLMVINSSVNFFIYVIFGKRFRQLMKQKFSRKRKMTAHQALLRMRNKPYYA